MNNLKSSFLIGLLMLMSLSAVWGQSRVNHISAVQSDTSIVRHWKDDVNVVYSHGSGGGNCFVLDDQTSPTVLSIPVSAYATVRDFRILRDTVFLAGSYYHTASAMHYGLLAHFAIQDFYNGMGKYNYVLTLPAIMPDLGYGGGWYNHVYDIMRLAVYDSSGSTKIAFIANNKIGGDTTRRVGVGYANYSDTLWDIGIIYNKYAIEEYTDIIATQNYVVAVARTNDSARLALRIYPKSNYLYPLGSYPADVFYPNKIGQGLSDLEVDENVMATALDGDEFAVAYHYTDSPGRGLAVKVFDITGGVASMTQGMIAPATFHSGFKWKMRDICYSPHRSNLVVLNDIDEGTAGAPASVVYQFPLPFLPTGTYNGRYHTSFGLKALDLFGVTEDAYISSGNSNAGSLLLYWEKLGFTSSCLVPASIKGSAIVKPLYKTFMQTNMNKPDSRSGYELFAVNVLMREQTCTRQSYQE